MTKPDETAATVEYTVILPEADVIALARGDVTPDVQNLAWSCLKAMHLRPEFHLRAPERTATR